MMAPAICIITALASADARYLGDAYRSLRAQELTDWEWVISEDGPGEHARHLAGRDPRVLWLNSPRPAGPAAARNLALGACAAGLVRNLDADDVLAGPRVLTDTAAVFEDPRVAYCLGRASDWHPDGSLAHRPARRAHGPIPRGALYRDWSERGCWGAGHPTTLSARLDAILACGGYPALAAAEDTALLMMLSQRERGFFIDRALTWYRKRPGSITTRPWACDRSAREARHRVVHALARAAGDAAPAGTSPLD